MTIKIGQLCLKEKKIEFLEGKTITKHFLKNGFIKLKNWTLGTIKKAW